MAAATRHGGTYLAVLLVEVALSAGVRGAVPVGAGIEDQLDVGPRRHESLPQEEHVTVASAAHSGDQRKDLRSRCVLLGSRSGSEPGALPGDGLGSPCSGPADINTTLV